MSKPFAWIVPLLIATFILAFCWFGYQKGGKDFFKPLIKGPEQTIHLVVHLSPDYGGNENECLYPRYFSTSLRELLR
jgi:hypothetical protein